MSPLDVLHVDTATEWRGGQRQLELLVTGMLRDGWATGVACPRTGRLWAVLSEAGVPLLDIPPGRDPRTTLRLRASDATLLAAHTSHAHTLCGPLRRPLVVHRRVDFVPSGGWKYRRPEAFVCVSEAVAEIVRSVGPTNVHVVYDGVSALAPRPPAADGPTVLAVGARVPHKGHDVLSAAAALLPDVDIGIAGPGDAAVPGVRLLGPRDDVAALHAAARVVVHPSREEGMGQAVVEAMLAALPVVATDAGGLPEVLGDTGIVVPKEDPAALASGILRALAGDHPPVAAAAVRARERFGVAQMVTSTCLVYRDILGGS